MEDSDDPDPDPRNTTQNECSLSDIDEQTQHESSGDESPAAEPPDRRQSHNQHSTFAPLERNDSTLQKVSTAPGAPERKQAIEEVPSVSEAARRSKSLTAATTAPGTLERKTSDLLGRERTRNQHFDSAEWEPYHDNDALQLQDDQVDGPLWFMNPTQAMFTYADISGLYTGIEGTEYNIDRNAEGNDDKLKGSNIYHKWSARDNRKGRHTLIVHESEETEGTEWIAPPITGSPRAMLRGIWRMFWYFSIWDVSFLTAIAFTMGCTVLVVNAILSFLPYANHNVKFPTTMYIVEAALAVFGCALFLTGSFLAYLEAVNADKKGCFGWKLERISYQDFGDVRTEHGAVTRLVPDDRCVHHHRTRGSLWERHEASDSEGAQNDLTYFASNAQKDDSWKLHPTMHDFRTHFLREIGYIANLLLLLSSLIYCSTAIAALATIVKSGQTAKWIRIPQIVAGIGFTVSSVLLTLECQKQWLRPAPKVLGWWIGLWNVIGSLGFTAAAILGFIESEHWAQRAPFLFGLSYLCGSWAFLGGSVMQWYEALDKYPVRRLQGHQ